MRVAAVEAGVLTAPSPIAAWCRSERVPDWPTDRWQMWLGQGKHFLVFPVRARRRWSTMSASCRPTQEMKESWSAPGDPDVLRARVRRLGSAHRQRAAAGRDDLPLGALRPRAAADLDQGRLTLLGDAAHPMLPHLGQGANQSIEDGMALATILAQADRATAPGGAAGLRAAAPRAGGGGAARRARERPALRLLPTPISASATPRSPRMPRSADSSTTMTWCRKRRPRRRR